MSSDLEKELADRTIKAPEDQKGGLLGCLKRPKLGKTRKKPVD